MQPHRSPRDQIMFIFKLVSALALSMAQRQAQTWLLSWNQFLSLKELPKSAEGHHPPSLPDRFSLWQKRLWTKSQSVNEHKHLPLREAKGRNCDSGEPGEQLSETVPLLSGDRGFLSALTPSPPGQHSVAQNSNWECLPHVQSSTTRAMRKNWSWSSFLQLQDQNFLQALHTLCI